MIRIMKTPQPFQLYSMRPFIYIPSDLLKLTYMLSYNHSMNVSIYKACPVIAILIVMYFISMSNVYISQKINWSSNKYIYLFTGVLG